MHEFIIYCDPGFQYTSFKYKVICESNGITISMSKKGTLIDDSLIESWHVLLKKTLYNNNITSLQQYIQLVGEWILFYNTAKLKSKVKKKEKNLHKKRKIIFLFLIYCFLLMSTTWGADIDYFLIY